MGHAVLHANEVPGTADGGEAFRVTFGPDIADQVRQRLYTLVDVVNVDESSERQAYEGYEDPPELLVTSSDHHTFDGERLVLSLGPEGTSDGKYSSIEIPNTRRFDQQILDHLMATGAPNVVYPGRQAIWRDVVFSEHFADGRANDETVNTGIAWQSWRGIEEEGLMPTTRRPRFVVAWFGFLGGPGIVPMIASRSIRRRVFWASIMDFNSGFMWFQPVPEYDPTVPHDLAIRWLPDRDVEFVVDGRRAAHYEDGKRRFWAMGLMSRQFGRGTDLFGHKFHTADPCHITAWINSTKIRNKISVPAGDKFHHDMWMALRGYEIEPLV